MSYLSGELESLITLDLAHLEPAAGTPVSAALDASHRILQLGAEVLQHVHLEVAGGRVPCSVISHSGHIISAPGEGLREGGNMLKVRAYIKKYQRKILLLTMTFKI